MSDQAADSTAPTANSDASGSGTNRPTSKGGKRVKTGVRRPKTAANRPDTATSEIGDLPEQKFFPEGDDFSEEEEEYSEEEPEGDVFAFARPVTAAPPGGLAAPTSEYGESAPPTGVPTTSGTHMTGATFGLGALRDAAHVPPAIAPTGNIDVGGHVPELRYDPSNPPPFSGRHNPNNSAFAFSVSSRGTSRPNTGNTSTTRNRPPTGTSLMDRLYKRNIGTAGTAMTGTTEASAMTGTTDFTQTSGETGSDAGSFTTETAGQGNGRVPRRMRSSQPLINGEEIMSEAGTQRGYSRGSYGMTELTGDMTVPDGKVTWHDGGEVKEGGGGEGGSLQGLDIDMAEEDSPYPEVRASVSNIDDVDMPALTLRAWILGLLFVIFCSGANTLFNFRTPAPYISPILVQIIIYPVGRFAAWVAPIRTFRNPKWLGGQSWSFNPGPFNIKEHTLIVMMANASISPAYVAYALTSMKMWYKVPVGFGLNILLVLSTQLTGFALSGVCRRFVIWPASMIWPGNLVSTTSLNAFHAEEDGYGTGLTRLKFLLYVAIGAFVWFFVPGYLFTGLSYFTYACWIAPKNNIVNQLFGMNTGLGMGIFTFDWAQINWIGAPLATPWWASVNVGIGFILFYWILVPIMYYNNVWQTAYLPMSFIQAADRYGNEYDVMSVLTPDLHLNTTAYAEYSPVYLSMAFSMTFMLAFALTTALLVHTLLYHGPRLYRTILNLRNEADDIHLKLMRHYPEVPDWWYAVLFLFTFVTAVVAIEVYHTGLPVWGYILAVLLPFIYILPAAFIFAMTSWGINLNLLAELIPGYIFQGQPIPGMLFKTFGVQVIHNSLAFLQDQKLGHYMKIPPRATFTAQIVAATVACFVQAGVFELVFTTVSDICTPTQPNFLNCKSAGVFFSASIVWGVIGPARLFSKGAMYYPQAWCAFAGALAPIPLWLWVRKYPRSIFRNLNLPVLLTGPLQIPPATGVNYASFLLTSFIFQFWIRRTRFAWWSKYNYVLSAALDVGTALGAIAIFLFLGLPRAQLNWWGNNVYMKTFDWIAAATYLPVPEEGFGPTTWKV